MTGAAYVPPEDKWGSGSSSSPKKSVAPGGPGATDKADTALTDPTPQANKHKLDPLDNATADISSLTAIKLPNTKKKEEKKKSADDGTEQDETAVEEEEEG